MQNKSFAQRMKEHQISWAHEKGFAQLPRQRVEEQRPWVLKEEHKTENLYDPTWWRYIEDKEHQWARSLLSSQCFAVNLFGPLAAKSTLAKFVLEDILPHRKLEESDEVSVCFEHTPVGAPIWLGELKTRQPTQVDVFFSVKRPMKLVGYLLIEVKLKESEFGSCRGGKRSTGSQSPGNPDPDRCKNLENVMADSREFCWIAGDQNGRLYWDLMLARDLPFNFAGWKECPFRYGLYQLMRNELLSFALIENTAAEWAETGVCIHPDNDVIREIKGSDVIKAFDALLPAGNVLTEIHPSKLIASIRKHDHSYGDWGNWMLSRYDLH